jgi:hypothetical protein
MALHTGNIPPAKAGDSNSPDHRRKIEADVMIVARERKAARRKQKQNP